VVLFADTLSYVRLYRHDASCHMTIEQSVRPRQQQGIQSVEIGMHVLGAIESRGGPASLSEVAATANMRPNKAHRYLVSLMRVGLVIQDKATSLYDLGPTARRLGIEALRRNDEVGVASTHVTTLRDKTGHTVNLSVWTDAGPALVRWDTGRHVLPITFRVGSVLPILESSVGRVFLAYLPRAQTQAAIAAQQRKQESAKLAARDVDAIVEEVTAAGFAYTARALVPGLAAIAAPVLDRERGLVMVIGIALPVRLATPKTRSRLTAQLLAAVDNVSVSLGYLRP
jgi:DNA-binding IclR family transcriptional regulator